MGEENTTTVMSEVVPSALSKDVDIDVYINEVHYVGRVTVKKYTETEDVEVIGIEKLMAQGDIATVYYNHRVVAPLLNVLTGEALHAAGEPFDNNIRRCDYSGYYLDRSLVCELANGDMCARNIAIRFDDEYYYVGYCSQHYLRDGDGDQIYIYGLLTRIGMKGLTVRLVVVI